MSQLKIMHLSANLHNFGEIARGKLRRLSFPDNEYWRRRITGQRFDRVRVTLDGAPAQFYDFKFTGYNAYARNDGKRMQPYLSVFLSERVEM